MGTQTDLLNTESKSGVRYVCRIEYFVAWLIGLLVIIRPGIILLAAISTYLESHYILAFVVWSAFILVLWVALHDTSDRFGYFITWIIGLLLLYVIQQIIILPAAIITYLENHYILAFVAWSAFILVLWTAVGDASNFHEKLFKRYRSIWIAFSVTVLTLFFTFCVYYIGVNDHVQALRGEAFLLENIISSDTFSNTSHTNLDYWASKGVTDTKQLITDTKQPSFTLGMSSSIMLDLHEDIHQLAGLTGLAERTIRELIVSQNEITKTKGITFAPLLPILTELSTTTKEISQTFSALQSRSITNTDRSPTQTAELLGHFEQARLLVANAKTALRAGSVNLASLFILIGILYAIVLLLPWLLLFLFLFRNLDFQVNNKLATLKMLRLDKTYIEKSKEESSREKDNLSPSEIIAGQAFRNREYVVGLVLLTIITGIMWYFVWYPLGWSGLAYGIVQGYSVKELTDYLISNASALTFGFMGAYFFVIQMLFRRYLAADLNPKPYINATVRMTIVFVLCLVLSTMDAWSIIGLHWIYPVAFLAGIFPMPVLQWIIHYVTEKIEWFKDLKVIRGPLTDLDGINIWHEERLMEESVENIQNLATAALDELVIHTNFYPTQLIHWVDQALLYAQTDEKWGGPDGYFHKAGIQTATDLCNADISRLAKSIGAIISQNNKDASPTLLTDGVENTIATMRAALISTPNYLRIKFFLEALKRNALNNQDGASTLSIDGIEVTIATMKAVGFPPN